MLNNSSGLGRVFLPRAALPRIASQGARSAPSLGCWPARTPPSRKASNSNICRRRHALRRACRTSRRQVSRRRTPSSQPPAPQPAAQPGRIQSGLLPAAAAACFGRPGRGRSGARRSDQARRRSHRQATGRSRPRAVAGAQSRLRRRRLLLAVLGAVAAMRADHLVDPADARQSRPHDERRAATQKRRRRAGRPAPRADRRLGAEQLRRAICVRRAAVRPGQFPRCAVRQRHDRQSGAATARRRAPFTPSACAPATAIISRSPIRPMRRASPTTRRPASGCARRRRRRSIRSAIRAKTWIRRCRMADSPTRRCRMPIATARKWCPAARAAAPARAGPMRSRAPTTRPRSNTATSSSPTRMPSCCRRRRRRVAKARPLLPS